MILLVVNGHKNENAPSMSAVNVSLNLKDHVEQPTVKYNCLYLKTSPHLFAFVCFSPMFSTLLIASTSSLLKSSSFWLCENRSKSSSSCNVPDGTIAWNPSSSLSDSSDLDPSSILSSRLIGKNSEIASLREVSCQGTKSVLISHSDVTKQSWPLKILNIQTTLRTGAWP